MAENKEPSASPIQLTVVTSEQRNVQTESKLFYIIPPLMVAAVFLYCMVSEPAVKPAAAATPAAVAEPTEIDMDEFSDEELEMNDDDNPNTPAQ